jgi:hypothetical protein
MYLGEWAVGRNGPFSENGFGVAYNYNPGCKGKIYIGEWKSGKCHGLGKSLWLESSNTWINNKLPASEILQKEGEKNVRRPYVYGGKYADNMNNDAKATVTLKDGTTRVGPWEKGKPVGDWWPDTDHPLTATATAASCGVTSSLSSESRATVHPSKSARTERSQNRAAGIEATLKKQITTGVLKSSTKGKQKKLKRRKSQRP